MSLVSQIQEQGWSVEQGWLSEAELTLLNQAFTEWQKQKLFTPAKIGQGQNLHEAKSIRGDETWWFDLANPPAELAPILARILALQTQLNRELYLGLKDWEVHLASYAAGAFYKKHLDRHAVSHRKLSLILYLNQHWDKTHGGELVMYTKSGEELTRILPEGGTLVAFLSEEFPHEVLPATRERRSLTGWFLDAPKGIV